MENNSFVVVVESQKRLLVFVPPFFYRDSRKVASLVFFLRGESNTRKSRAKFFSIISSRERVYDDDVNDVERRQK